VTLFDYPKDKFEIQILDDSTDETVEIVAKKVAEYKALGFNIYQHRRETRVGYKAGALKEGLEISKGEFIAIFDADFVPKEDFLNRTIPYFENENKPDIVISGINIGANMGEDITYSGTAAAAMEAVLQGIPAIAISQVYNRSGESIEKYGYDLAKESIATLVKKIFDGKFPLPERKFLNVNIPPIPPSECQGFKVTRAGNKKYGFHAEVHFNPRGKEYYWIGLPKLEWLESKGHTTDFEAIGDGYVSITPIQLDMTSHDDIEKLSGWLS